MSTGGERAVAETSTFVPKSHSFAFARPRFEMASGRGASMLKTLCALLISFFAANAHAQARINNMDAKKFREASESIMKSEMRSHPRTTERIALFRQAYLSHGDRHTPATRVMYEVTRQLIEEDVAVKTAAFKASRDSSARQALAQDIKLLNEALRIYDFASAPSASRGARNVR
jgi:hypothetical protein